MEKPIRRFESPIIIKNLTDVQNLYLSEGEEMTVLRPGDTLMYTDDQGVRREVCYEDMTTKAANDLVDRQVRHILQYSKDHKAKTYAEVYHEYLNRYPQLKAKITGVPVWMEGNDG